MPAVWNHLFIHLVTHIIFFLPFFYFWVKVWEVEYIYKKRGGKLRQAIIFVEDSVATQTGAFQAFAFKIHRKLVSD